LNRKNNTQYIRSTIERQECKFVLKKNRFYPEKIRCKINVLLSPHSTRLPTLVFP
jgi:hypothetical protein